MVNLFQFFRFLQRPQITRARKMRAIKQLDTEACLRFNRSGEWYLDLFSVCIEDGNYRRDPVAFTPDPYMAIDLAWRNLTAPGTIVVVGRSREERRRYAWIGSRWQTLPESVKEVAR